MQNLMTKKPKSIGNVNLQDMFLNQVRKEAIPVSIFLMGGIQLKGHVKGFDSFTVLLEPQGKPSQLVYKHGIASIVASKPVYLNRLSNNDEGITELPDNSIPLPE
jgi:host factor-I protein